MSDNLRRRIESLEAGLPREIVLTLDDGGTYRHSGPAIRFFDEGMRQLWTGKGTIVEAVARTIEARGCGRLWQVLAALRHSHPNDGRTATPPLAKQGARERTK